MPITERQAARFTGDKPSQVAMAVQGGVLPVAATQALQDMRFPGAWVGANIQGPGIQPKIYTGGGMASVAWDPPVGGFPLNDVLVQFPGTGPPGIGTIVTSFGQGALLGDIGFAPGIYDIWIDFCLAGGMTEAVGVEWHFHGSGGAPGSVGALTDDLGPGIPDWGVRCVGMTSTLSRQLPILRLAAEVRWSATLWVCNGPLTDPMRGQTAISITPRVLYDEAGNVF